MNGNVFALGGPGRPGGTGGTGGTGAGPKKRLSLVSWPLLLGFGPYFQDGKSVCEYEYYQV